MDPLTDDWQTRLSSINWSQYETVYGEATAVEARLRSLRSADEDEALAAASDLVCRLCLHEVMIASSALPALPFLLEVCSSCTDNVRAEVLDILLGLAITSNAHKIEEFAVRMRRPPIVVPQWVHDVRTGLENALPDILPLRNHVDPWIASYAQGIAEELASTNPRIEADVARNPPVAADFDAAVLEFTRFVVNEDYPPNLHWVQPSDIIELKWKGTWTWFVWDGKLRQGVRLAGKAYRTAVFRGLGVALEALAKTNRWTVCRVFAPADEGQAGRLMIPRSGVKRSARNVPFPVVFVESNLRWRFLKWLARNSPPAIPSDH